MTSAEELLLSSELLEDPRGKGYSDYMPDAPGMVVQFLNELSESKIKQIKSTTAQAWAASGPYSNIVDTASNLQHPCRASCLMLRDTLVSGVDIYVDRPDVQYMLSMWVATNVITKAQSDDLYTRAIQPASRLEVLGISSINEEDVRKVWQL